MAKFVASAEVALQLTGFRNVDLYSQGIYQLRISAAGKVSGRMATPFAIVDAPTDPNHPNARQFHLPAHILDATSEFCSPAFRVRYSEEEVLLRPLVRMKVDLDVTDGDPSSSADEASSLGLPSESDAAAMCGFAAEELQITVKLMHARSTTVMDISAQDPIESHSLRHFKAVATQTVIAKLPLPTISSFFPVTFSDWHFCYAPIMLHATPLSFRVMRPPSTSPAAPTSKPSPPPTPRLGKQRQREDAALASLVSSIDAAASSDSSSQYSSNYGPDGAAGGAGGASAPSGGEQDAPSREILARASDDLHRKAGALLKAALALSARIAVLERELASKPKPASRASRAKSFVTAPPSEAPAAAPPTPRLHLPDGVELDAIALQEATAAADVSEAEAPAVAPAVAPAAAPAVAPAVSPAPAAEGGSTSSSGQGKASEEAIEEAAVDVVAAALLEQTGGTLEEAREKVRAMAKEEKAAAGKKAEEGEKAAAPAAAVPLDFLPEEASTGAVLEEQLLGRVSKWKSTKASDVDAELNAVLGTLRVSVADAGNGGEGGVASLPTTLPARVFAERALSILGSLSEQIWPRWQRLLDLVLEQPEAVLGALSDEFVDSTSQRLGESVFREARLFEQRAYAKQAEGGMPTALMAASLRSSAYYKQLPAPRLRDSKWHANQQPVLFERRYVSNHEEVEKCKPRFSFTWTADEQRAAAPAPKAAIKGVHVLVFVHGFQGNSYDLRTMRDHLALVHPRRENLRYLCSSSNEEHTSKASFEVLGANLATELRLFLRNEQLLEDNSCRISFVCHSFGSIIARVALARPDMQDLHSRLHTYLSFSGPHLGMLYGSNGLVELGMWGLRRWSGAKCLTELSLKDAKDPHDSLLYRLSKQPVLGAFQNVLFVSSVEDRYVPHHSARVQLTEEAIHDAKHGSLFISMVHHLTVPLANVNLVHIEVHFGDPPGKLLVSKIDAAIGRAAHIGFLDNEPFVQMFVNLYLRYFV